MTPTREQVIEWAEEAGAIQLHEEGWGPVIQGSVGDMQRFAVLAMERAHTAGRDQGLREAKGACDAERVEDTGTEGDVAYNMEIGHCAAAIEQLRFA